MLYGCEALREEHRLRVLENRILRRIFGPKRDENGEWRIDSVNTGVTSSEAILINSHLNDLNSYAVIA